ncbi:MAG: hypothetical protein WKF30_12125 [Pyrinomonadaceae bacterium]
MAARVRRVRAAARRIDARFCCVCGRRLSVGYLPADALRASYRAHETPASARRQTFQPATHTVPMHPPKRGVAKNGNGLSLAALAFVTYALVPYLGILFCVPAVVMGGFGLARWRRAPLVGGRRASMIGIVLGLLILGVQLFLWWIIYQIPRWAQL